MRNLLKKAGAVGGLCLAGALPVSADTLYSNMDESKFVDVFKISKADLDAAPNGVVSIGDRIILAGGSLFDLSQFKLNLWGSGTGTVQVRLGLFANDGSPIDPTSNVQKPGTSLGQTDWFTFNLNDPAAVNNTVLLTYDASEFHNLQTLPYIFTWAMDFKGLSGSDQAGLDIFSEPSTGANFPAYWQNTGSDWELMTNTVTMNFGAQIQGTAMVPEPSSMALLGLGGLGLMALARRSRRQE